MLSQVLAFALNIPLEVSGVPINCREQQTEHCQLPQVAFNNALFLRELLMVVDS